jgi:hypothetical protein
MTSKGLVIPPPEDRFHANVVAMTGLIREIVQDANKVGFKEISPFVVDMAAGHLKQNYKPKDLIEGFITHSHPPKVEREGLDHTLWDKILAKDEDFFREEAFNIFKTLPATAVDSFRRLSSYQDPKTGEPVIGAKRREQIIKYFFSFVKIAIKYIHAMREPRVISGEDGKTKYIYNKPHIFKGIDVLSHAKKWNVELEFSRE